MSTRYYNIILLLLLLYIVSTACDSENEMDKAREKPQTRSSFQIYSGEEA